MSNELITVESKELQSIEKSKALQIKAVFDPMAETLLAFEKDFNVIVKEYESGVTEELVKKARRLRLDISKVRISTEKTRKIQKEEYLKAGKAIDGVANVLKWAVNDKESKLSEIETHFERLEQQRLDKLQHERVELLSEYVDDAHDRDLASMENDVWEAYLSAKKTEHFDRVEAERVAEEKRVESERLDKLEKERLSIAIEYKQFWEHDGYPFRKMSDDEFKVLMSSLKLEKIKYDKEQESIRKENKRLKKEAEEKEEKERKVREEYQRKVDQEQKEKEKVRAQLEAIKQEEENRRLAEESRIQDELKKGDSDKIKDMVVDLTEIKCKYEFKSKKNIKLYQDVKILIDKVIDHINQ